MIWNQNFRTTKECGERMNARIYDDAGYLMLQKKGPKLCFFVSLLYRSARRDKIGRMFAGILIVLILVVG